MHEQVARLLAEARPPNLATLNLSDGAENTFSLAEDEAGRFSHNYVGSEHILLGLARGHEGIAGEVLDSVGVELPKVRTAVEFIIGRGDRPVVGRIGFTKRAKHIIGLSALEAYRLGATEMRAEHLLLGIVAEGECIAAGILRSLDAPLDEMRDLVNRAAAARAVGLIGEPVQLLYTDQQNRIHLLSGFRATDGRVTVNTPQFATILIQSIVTPSQIRALEAAEEFEDLINSDDLHESAVQRFLAEHKDFLLGADYEDLHSQVVLSREGQEDLRPDFLLRPLRGVSYEPALVELKLPSQQLIKPTPRREGFYAQIYEAVMQLRRYAAYFREERNREYIRRILGFTAYHPRLVLVVGRRLELADEQVRAEVISSIQPVELVTYEDILIKYKNKVAGLARYGQAPPRPRDSLY